MMFQVVGLVLVLYFPVVSEKRTDIAAQSGHVETPWIREVLNSADDNLVLPQQATANCHCIRIMVACWRQSSTRESSQKGQARGDATIGSRTWRRHFHSCYSEEN